MDREMINDLDKYLKQIDKASAIVQAIILIIFVLILGWFIAWAMVSGEGGYK